MEDLNLVPLDFISSALNLSARPPPNLMFLNVVSCSFSEVDNRDDHLKMLLLEAAFKGSGVDPGDRLVNASLSGNLQDVREILEANPDKVTQSAYFICHVTKGLGGLC